MIRRDYIIRMIEDFIQMLSRLDSLKRGQLWNEAGGMVDAQFEALLGAGAQAAARLSETELLAALIKGEPTQAVREKTLMLTALFKEAGEVAVAKDRADEGRAFYLKALHLLLEMLALDEPLECPAFVPRVESLVTDLQDLSLPLETQARLMQHYERIGEFAKAEDCLFALLTADPANPGLRDFGMSFYNRVQAQSDAHLAAGNLPRAELEAGLAEFQALTQAGREGIAPS